MSLRCKESKENLKIKVRFRKSGYWTTWGYQRFFHVEEYSEGEFRSILRVGRDTLLAMLIEKYVIKTKFLSTGKRKLEKDLTIKQFQFLKGLCEAGSKYWQLYAKALDEKWSMKKISSQIFWRIV